jgi:hypothetical protein
MTGGTVQLDFASVADLVPLGSYGDECDTTTLDAAWTLRNISSVTGDGHAYPLLLDAQGDAITRSFTDTGQDFEIMAHMYGLNNGGGMIGLCALDSSNNGRGFSGYNDNNTYQWALTNYAYASTGVAAGVAPNLPNHWLRLRRASNLWTGYISNDGGYSWNATATTSDSRTIAKIGVLRAYTSGGSQTLYLARFVYGSPTITFPTSQSYW